MAKSKQIVPVTPSNLQRDFVRCFEAFDRQHSRHTVFRDFVETAALAYSNKFDLRQYEEREKRYMEIIKPYSREDVHRFPELLGMAALSFEKFGPHDFFGELYEHKHLDLANKHMGQFFTPYAVSLMMAKISMHDCKDMIEKDGFIRMMEPCSGSGGMVAAAAQAVEEEGHDYRQVMHVTAIDLDRGCTHMTYLTCTLLGIPAIVYNGNSLSSEPMRSTWYTPAHILGGWGRKLRDRRQQDALSGTELWQALHLQAAE